MPRVICTLPNASNLISGVVFEDHEDGVISEEISDEQAERFLSIPGYYLDGEQGREEKKPENSNRNDDADLEALQAKAEALGIKVNPRWKHERLNTEIARAEAAAAEAAAAEAAAADGEGSEDQF